MNTISDQQCFEFEDFRLDALHLVLFRNYVQINLPPKVIETLVAFVEHNDRILNKDELMQIVWPDTVVDESNIFQNLYLLRKTLGNKSDGSPFIETLRRRGYRFSAAVKLVTSTSEPLSEMPVHLTADLGNQDPTQLPANRPDRQFSNGALIIWAAVLICIIVTGVASVFYRPWGGISVEANTDRQMPGSIAVLPFRAIGPDSDRLRQGICDALITRFGNNNKVVVRPTSAVRQYTNPDQDIVEIGRMQGVEAVLDGSIQQNEGRIRVTVQLIDTLSGVTIWSAQFDTNSANSLDVQDSISERVIAEMTHNLSSMD